MAVSKKKGIALAGTILVEKQSQFHCVGLQKLSCAGCVGNIALMLKKLSPRMKVSAVGTLGDDTEGRYAVQHLSNSGIAVSGLRLIPEEKTGYVQENRHCGAVQQFGLSNMTFRDLSCNTLHLGYFLTLDKIDDGDGRKILKHARQCGMETSASLCRADSERYAAVLAALPYVDYFTVSLSDAAWLVKMDPETHSIEQIARRLLWYGVKKKVFVFSDQWVACCSDTEYVLLGNYILPEFEKYSDLRKQDSFCAGVLTGVYHGWSNMKTLEFATSCMAAACSVEEIESISQPEDFCKELKRYKKVL